MSFSSDCKTEMCRAPTDRPCCVRAELYGCLLLGHTFGPRAIRVLTGHEALCRRLSGLLRLAFGLEFQVGQSGRKKSFSITDTLTLNTVLDGYGHDDTLQVAVHLNRAVLEDECCMFAFTRGAFLTGGFAASPDYHLELVTPHVALSRELSALLSELGLPAKTSRRAGHQVLYYKASENIEDFLTLCGAPLSALALMGTKVEKDFRNHINRRVNCETANSAKAVSAALIQREAFARLKSGSKWDELSEPLKQAAEARLMNPEDTLVELANRLGVSKSCLNHRFRKLIELSGCSEINND